VIRILLRLYPPAWRERYGAELSELVSATGLGRREALDLVRAAMHERRLTIHAAITGGTTVAIGPAWRHPSGWAAAGLVLMAPTLTFVVGSILAYQLGVTSIQSAMDAANGWLATQPRILDLLLVLAPAAALLLAVAPLLRVDLRDAETGRQAVVAIRLRALNLITSVLALAVGGLLLWHFLAESMVRAAA
jgi:hypothetical protein